MTVTDIVTLILSISLLIRGASRGLMNSLTGPISMIVATIISIIYYQTTKNIVVSLGIGLIGPLLLNLLFKNLLKTWTKFTDSSVKLNPLSELAGAILTLIWGWVFIILTLLLLVVLPPWGNTLQIVHNDVTKSKSYLIIKPFENFLLTSSKSNVKAVTSESFAKDDAKSLAEDPRFQRVLQDPDIQNEINTHDIGKLMSNPKMMALVQQIMSDPATMKKVMALYKSQAQPQVSTNP